ncbi:MAG: hypothetical protein Kow0063_09020 [Anaerolineae bacterium]
MNESGSELRQHLDRFRHRLRLRDAWLLAQRTLWLACLAGVAMHLAGRVWPVERLWLWSLAPLLIWALLVAVILLFYPMPAGRVARRVDHELGLKERLTTALFLESRPPGELAGQSSNQLPKGGCRPAFHPTLIALQREDALSLARQIDPPRAFPLSWLSRPLLLAGVLAVAAVTLALLPNPMDAVLAERAAVAQAAGEQAAQIEKLREEVENEQGLTPEMRQELLRQLAELAEQLRANPGDRPEALADLSRVEEALRQKLDPNTNTRQAALESLAAQLEALAGAEAGEEEDLPDMTAALESLAQGLAGMDAAEREALARALAGAAARAGQAGDSDLAQALAALAQAIQSGESEAAGQAAQAAGQALSQAQAELADQAALQQVLAELQEGRQAIAGAGQGQGLAQGQQQAQGPGQGAGQGQGQPGGGGGTKADRLPPANSTGQADRPQGAGPPGSVGELEPQVYVPWERRQASGDELSITGQGETQTREQSEPAPGAPGPALVPYSQVYYEYLDAANQTIERSAIPPGLRDYVRDYFSRLEP